MIIDTKHTIPLLRAVQSGQIKGGVSLSSDNWSLYVSSKLGVRYNYYCCDDPECNGDESYQYKNVDEFASKNPDFSHVGRWWLDVTITDNVDQVKDFIKARGEV